MKNRRQISERPDRRMIAGGELLAIDSRAIIKGPDAFFWMFGPICPPMKRVGDAAIIHVRGPLEHHADGWSCSYEQILEESELAKSGDDENDPAKRIILSVDSPGGVVSGLYECVDALKKLKLPIDAYVEGLCASAAYALATSCSKIYCSRSAILGSVGVIATMYSQRRRDKAMGIDVVTITSGKRKADGHPHVAISEDAIRAEEKRVRKFAEGFFELVEDARGFDPELHEAGLFVGSDAVKAGYADAIKTLDEKTLDARVRTDTIDEVQTDTNGVSSDTGDTMRLSTLIDRTKAAIKSEKDPEKKAALRLKLSAYEATRADTKKTYEHEKEVEETTDEPEEEEESDEDDDDGGGGNDTDREDEAEDEEEESAEDEEESAESEEDDEKECDREEKKAAKALASLKLKGPAKKAVALAMKALDKSAATRKAMRGELKGQRKLAKQVAELAEANERRDRNAVIEGALASGRITPAEAKQLRKQSTDHVAAFLSARPKAIVRQGSLAADIKTSSTMVSREMNNFAPSEVTAEITAEMREAAERAEMLSGGKVKAADFLKEFQASVTKGVH